MIPTAEEFYIENSKFRNGDHVLDTTILLKEFAKLHVKAALTEASKKAKTKKTYRGNDSSMLVKKVIDKDSILNSYPLTNIK